MLSARQGDGAPPVPACRKSVKNRAIQNAGRLYSLAETQREVLDRINRINRIDGSGDSNALQSNLDTPTHENPVVPRVGEPIFFCRERQSSDRAFRIWEAHKRFRRVKYCIDRAGGGERAIGVSRDSYLKFIARRVAVLLALLSLGFKNIRLGPTLPAFLSPHVVKVLSDHFGLKPIGSVDDDVLSMME